MEIEHTLKTFYISALIWVKLTGTDHFISVAAVFVSIYWKNLLRNWVTAAFDHADANVYNIICS